MLYSQLFGKTSKTAPADEDAVNAQLLIRASFVHKVMAGVWSYLPLGLRVLNKIKNIVREEINAIGGQEILMSALQSKELWLETGRWDSLQEIMFQFKDHRGSWVGLGTTHEEPVVAIARSKISSYKDLPFALYQIQDKFRDEPRPRSGLLRGREFSMKDLYSFHTSKDDLDKYYEKVKKAYLKIFKRCGLKVMIVEASGGVFSKENSHEFQVLVPSGEDTVFYCEKCGFAQNKEIAKVKEGDICPKCGSKILSSRAIEVGNIFKLGTKYSEPMKLFFRDKDKKEKPVIMGCYGLGPSRVMGAIVEVSHDDKGIIWPEEVSPFCAHLLDLSKNLKSKVRKETEKIYQMLEKAGWNVLWDNRLDSSPGEKFADADLIGIPIRILVSEKTLEKESVEIKYRKSGKIEIVKIKNLIKKLS
jgi:prolyl-tRNA synthetase